MQKKTCTLFYTSLITTDPLLGNTYNWPLGSGIKYILHVSKYCKKRGRSDEGKKTAVCLWGRLREKLEQLVAPCLLRRAQKKKRGAVHRLLRRSRATRIKQQTNNYCMFVRPRLTAGNMFSCKFNCQVSC